MLNPQCCWHQHIFNPSLFYFRIHLFYISLLSGHLQLYRKEHWKLLSSLKTTVEGLVSTNNPNVWSRYGGLQRLHKDMNNILSNGLKNEQVIMSLTTQFYSCWNVTQQSGLSFLFVLFFTGSGVLQASGLLAFRVVHSLHQSPSGVACWTGTFIGDHVLWGIWLFFPVQNLRKLYICNNKLYQTQNLSAGSVFKGFDFFHFFISFSYSAKWCGNYNL